MDFMDRLFDDPGGSLKKCARNLYRNMLIFSVIAMVVCVFFWLVYLSDGYTDIAFAILFGGAFAISVELRISYLVALKLTADGDLVETNRLIAQSIENLNETEAAPERGPVTNAHVSKLYARKLEAAREPVRSNANMAYVRKKATGMNTPAGDRTIEQILGFMLQLPTEEDMREHLMLQINSDITPENKEICRQLLDKPDGLLRNSMFRMLMHQQDAEE